MARMWSKFWLLMWKNWMLQRRHPVQTVVEILAPVFFSVLLVVVRLQVEPENITEPTRYEPFSPENYSGSVVDYMANMSFLGVVVTYSPGSPNGNSVVDTIMRGAVSHFHPRGIAIPFSSEDEMLLNLTRPDAMNYVLAAVVFDDALANMTEFPEDIQYKVRFPGESRFITSTSSSTTGTWRTDRLFPTYQTLGPRMMNFSNGGNVPGYYTEGFLYLQHCVSVSIIEMLSGNASVPSVQLQRLPYPPYLSDPLLVAMENMVSLFIMLSFTYTCISITRVITNEKELQLKESMKIMGLPNWLHWTAWFINSFLLLLISVALMTILMKVPWNSASQVSVFTRSNGIIIFIFLLLYAVSTICFCFMISSFFSTANLAATMAGLGWFMLYVPYTFVQLNYEVVALGAKMAMSLCTNTAMSLGLQLILMFEGTGRGLQWDTLWQPATQDDNLFFGHIIIFLVVDSVLYLLIALYVEAVFPGAYGVPKPWYFLVQRSFWCGDGASKREAMPDSLWTRRNSSASIESEPSLPVGIEIKQLCKVYNKKVAVDNLNLNMYEGQITVLLGHNGAGKTTTISLLTGMLTPTSGTAVVNGHDVRTEIDKVRGSLGLCPQHNVLFNELTVAEHIYFFGKLKGMGTDEIKDEIQRYLTVLELLPKENLQAHTLSGGMKRKLSAAIALCGHSKVVVIDEPTSGMDPAARRTLWNLLQMERAGRTILLTTHFMDEADFLGDRIAIMAGGKLRCCGSPFYLKKRYGVGYQLVVVKSPECDVDEVTNLLRRHIPSLEVNQNVASELSYLLEEDSSSVFEPMLRELEDSKAALRVDSFGVSLTNMEEVFIKVGRDQELTLQNGQFESISLSVDHKLYGFEDQSTSSYGNSNFTINDVKAGDALTGCRLARNQIQAMFVKHILHTVRSWIVYALHVLLPVVFLILALLFGNMFVQTTVLPALDLSLESYSNPVTPVEVVSSNNVVEDLYRQFKNMSLPGLVNLGSQTQSIMSNYVLEQAESDIAVFNQRFIVASTFGADSENSMPEATGWFNNQPFHALPVALNLVHNSILRSLGAGSRHSISVVNHPLPFSANTQVRIQSSGNSMGFQVAFNFVFSMSFVSAFFVLFYVKERVTKAKLLQFVSGADVVTFWGTAFVWDFFKFLIIDMALIITLLCFQEDGFKSSDQLGRIFVMLMLYCLAMLPMTYLASFLFSVPSSGYTRIVMFNIITGMAGMMLVTMFRMPSLGLEDVGDVLDWVFIIVFPLYSLGSSVNHMYTNAMLLETCAPFMSFCSEQTPNPCCTEPRFCPNGTCVDMVENYFDWKTPGIGRNVVFFFVSAVALSALLLLIEFEVFSSILYRTKVLTSSKAKDVAEEYEPDDSDVVMENFKVRSVDSSLLKNSYDMLLIDLTKYYGKFLAVNKLCVGVRKGECFGLLGINGAGKTSTFKMLTGDETISNGEAYISGFSLKTQMKQVHQQIGYCPQFDALIDSLTGRETLWLFCMLRGIPKEDIPFTINKLSDQLLFTKHIDKKVREYSGGNKRKLSTAVALIGDPPVVYLDEPTSGMDVVAKRHLWNVICKVRDNGKCIVLTSHSMEECEALCTRIAIMVNGQFKCLGPTQHLKNKFAEGYTLTIKVSETSFNTQPVKEFVSNTFEGATLREEHESLLTFYIPSSSNLTWSRMFGVMEQAKSLLHISDYSLGQTSLEQVFLMFTKQQTSYL